MRKVVRTQPRNAIQKPKSIQPRKSKFYRMAISAPTRNQLSRNEWIERGDLIRSIKNYLAIHGIEYIGLDSSSLADLRDTQEAINRLHINIIYQDFLIKQGQDSIAV